MRLDLMSFLGHTRPLCGLAAKIVKLRPVHITLLTTQPFCERVKAEVARNFGPDEEFQRTLVRCAIRT